MSNQVQLGSRFARLLVVADIGRKRGHRLLLCHCDCGRVKIAKESRLKNGDTKSCGCYRIELAREKGYKNRSHGQCNLPEYNLWATMIQRCTNPRKSSYHYYGGRGIKVCERWLNSFEAFFADIGPRPLLESSLDRIDNDGNYEPGNVRWATPQQQAENKRGLYLISYHNKTQTVTKWAKEFKINRSTLFSRLYNGWPIERALNVKS